MALALAACLLAACGDDDSTSVLSAGSDTASFSSASATGSSSAAGSDTASSGDTTSSPPSSSTDDGQPAGPPPPPGSQNGAPDLDGHVDVGLFAPALLQPGLSQRIVVEVRNQSGAAPSQATLDHVVGILEAASRKSVSTQGGPAVSGGARTWTSTDIREAADEAGTMAQGNGTAVIRLLFVHGSYGGDTGVLGVAARGDVAAVLVDQVKASTPLLGDPVTFETAVTTHEVGHLLGLVDLYRKTGRQDPDHPGHSTNPHSVMYWAVESNLIASVLEGGPPTDFDDADRADLAVIAAGG